MDNREAKHLLPPDRRALEAFAIVVFLTMLAIAADGFALAKYPNGRFAAAGVVLLVEAAGWGCLSVTGFLILVGLRLGDASREEADENYFRTFMDQYPTVSFLKDGAGRVLYANQAYYKTFQTDLAQRLGKLASCEISSAIGEQIRANDQKAIRSKFGLQFEETVPDQSGALRNWLTFKFPVTGRGGEVRLGGIAIEITGSVKAQAALRESESRYRQIVEYAGDVIVRCDRTGRVTYVNEMAVRILQMPAGRLLGRRALSLVRRDARRSVRGETWAQILQGVTDFYTEVPVVAKDGSELWLGQNIRVLREGGSIQGFQAICRDITERRRMEAELRANEERFRLLYENGPVAYHQIDRKGVIQRVNRAECEMLGYPEAQLVGRSVLELMTPKDREAARTAIPGKIGQEIPLRPFTRVYLRSDGRRLRLEIHENLLRDNHGEVIGIHSVLLDVTQRHLAERLNHDRRELSEMIAQQQPLDRILSGIAAMICHQDESLLCIPLRLNEQRLEPVCMEKILQPLCEFIRLKGCHTVARWLPGGLCVSHHSIGDLLHSPGFHGLAVAAKRLGMRACWSMPIISSKQQPLGLLLVFSPQAGEAPPQVQHMLEAVGGISALAIEHRYLTDLQAFQASHDALTRLSNRRTFEARLQNAILTAKRNGEQLALFFIDLDRFKAVNDTFGHNCGDELLRQVAARLQSSIRHTDLLARIGGDEFSVLLEGLRETSDANRLAELILRAFEVPFAIDGWEIHVTASIGISFYPGDGQDASTLQRNSDTAMYRVKESGKNSFRCFGKEYKIEAELVV